MSRETHIDHLLQQHIVSDGVAPLAAAAVASCSTQSRWSSAWGAAGTYAPLRDALCSDSTLFDLASLTKPLFAVCLAHWLARSDSHSLDTPLGDWLQSAQDSALASLSIGALLSHRSGLKPHLELYAEYAAGGEFRRAQEIARVLGALRPGIAPGNIVDPAAVYSDLGYVLLGLGWEQQLGRPLHLVLEQELSRHGMLYTASAESLRKRSSDAERHFAPTEEVAWRGGLIAGQVHDDNAWLLSGTGCSGHAGLFGTVHDVARFGCAVLDSLQDRHPTLDRKILQTLTRRRDGSSLRMGFDGKVQGEASSVGNVLGPETFGHLGFTGTSFWCDPENLVVVVLLTNRVCPSRRNLGIRRARPFVHDALAARGLALRN